MAEVQTDTYEEVLRIVQDWPFSQRIALVQDILRILAPELAALEPMVQSKGSTLQEALGLLAVDQPAPSDETIQAWLDEHRLEKYNR